MQGISTGTVGKTQAEGSVAQPAVGDHCVVCDIGLRRPRLIPDRSSAVDLVVGICRGEHASGRVHGLLSRSDDLQEARREAGYSISVVL